MKCDRLLTSRLLHMEKEFLNKKSKKIFRDRGPDSKKRPPCPNLNKIPRLMDLTCIPPANTSKSAIKNTPHTTKHINDASSNNSVFFSG